MFISLRKKLFFLLLAVGLLPVLVAVGVALYQYPPVGVRDNFILKLMGGMLLGTLVLNAGLSFYLVRRLTGPLNQLSKKLREFARGNLGVRLDVTGRDEISEISRDFNQMAQTIQDMRLESDNLLAKRSFQLTDSEEQLRALLESTEEGIWMTDLNFKFLYSNSHAKRLLPASINFDDATSDITVWMKLSQLFPEHDVLKDFLDLQHTQQEKSFQFVLEFPQNKARFVRFFITPVSTAGRGRIARLVMLRDVTQETELDRMKNEFISTVSHELRTPLTSISGYCNLILDGDTGDINPTQREFLEVISRNTARLNNLITDLLDVQRIESGRITMKCKPIDLIPIIRNAVDTFQVIARKKGLELKLTGPARCMINAESNRLEQCFANLVSNAVKYTETGGVHIQVFLDRGMISVDVIDSGIGLDEEDQRCLFRKFFRAENPKARDAGGTGLGLAIVKAIIEGHGGSIHVKSVLGQGSTFSVRLPALSDAVMTPSIPITTLKRKVPKVLSIDDDTDILNLVALNVQKLGGEALVATSREQAVLLMEDGLPDLILLDLMMPDVDGWTLLQEFKSREETKKIPVIMFSITPERDRSLELGAADFLFKPMNEELFCRTLMRVLPNRFSLGSAMVVDDEPGIVELVKSLLRKEGLQVEGFTDPIQASRKLADQKFDLLVVDENMPDISGTQILQQIRAGGPNQKTPSLVLSGYRVPEQEGKIHQAMDVKVLFKGEEPEKLVSTIIQHFYEKRKAYSEEPAAFL